MNAPKIADRSPLSVSLVRDDEELRACQRLRHAVFAREMGARLPGRPGLDEDHFDAHCRHLLVRDAMGTVVGTTRILFQEAAVAAGGFYSQEEFDATLVLALPGRFMELGRTCIHPAHRRGPALALLWQGVLAVMESEGVDYLIGCLSIPFGDTGAYPRAVMRHLKPSHRAPESLRVHPRVPLPRVGETDMDVVMPPLLRAYLRLGAVVCGEPHWDLDFNVADLFMLLERSRLDRRYLGRFLARA